MKAENETKTMGDFHGRSFFCHISGCLRTVTEIERKKKKLKFENEERMFFSYKFIEYSEFHSSILSF